ncbi:LCP family protein [Clostridium sp. E02]|uniref:LCP family protein n=1 Tax=Clostridium sp. E02 TaxID=2487134 RepID=UPI000F53E334|nr:LCP family protein [Clostridium sp. E02]
MKNEFDDELNRDPKNRGTRNTGPQDQRPRFKKEQQEPMFRGQQRRQPSSGGQTTSRTRGSSDGKLVIGDGKTRQQSRIAAQEKNAANSRSAAQAAKKRKIRRFIILAVFELFTLGLIFSYAYAQRLMGSIIRPENFNEDQVRNEDLSQEQKKHMTGFRTIAIFGVDSRDGNVNRGTNADVIMICNINRENGEIRLASVFRDTYLNINDRNTYNKINSAYANGGASQALAALNKNLDLDISEYVTFNWKSVADGINMLGGVDIDISKPEFRYINSFITETVKKTGVPSVHLKSAGMNHLDGVQAVAYARLRKMDTDYARTERQRLVIEKSFAKAKKADLGLLNRILLMEVEQVGSNLTFSDFTELLLDINKYHIGETGGFPFARGDLRMGKKGDCVIPQTLETNVGQLHKFLFGKENYQASAMVKKISAKIAADSGMYKKGTSVDHVPTDKGYVPDKTKEETKKETTEADETKAEDSLEGETDEFGFPVSTTESSDNSKNPTKETKPGETLPSESTSGHEKPWETQPTKPDGKPGETKPTKPGNTNPTQETQGPGTEETTAETKATETTKANYGPGTIDETFPVQPGTDQAAPVVPAPPMN